MEITLKILISQLAAAAKILSHKSTKNFSQADILQKLLDKYIVVNFNAILGHLEETKQGRFPGFRPRETKKYCWGKISDRITS